MKTFLGVVRDPRIWGALMPMSVRMFVAVGDSNGTLEPPARLRDGGSALGQGLPPLGPWTNTGSWPLRNQAAQEVSGR